jgi:DNA polymerase-3 subunit gamma/tau
VDYIALYRKYRPQSFDEVVEQDTIVKILRQALKQNKIAHAYLFAGPKGSGKTTIARIFAKGLNCSNGPTDSPCMECKNCVSITNGNNLDVLEIDAASNRGIDEIRDLKEKVYYVPVASKYKVYIIDEAHMLTMQAFNALLKTLEEPPHNVVFILATTEPDKIPSTIISRCERFYFKPISTDGLLSKVVEVASKEGVGISRSAALLIAKLSSGSLRNALSILDQAITMYSDNIDEEHVRSLLDVPEEEIFTKFLYAILGNDAKSVVGIINGVKESGRDPKIFLNELIDYIQDIITGKISGFGELERKRDKQFVNIIQEQAKYFSLKKLSEFAGTFVNSLSKVKLFQDPFFPMLLDSLSLLTEMENIETTEAFKIPESVKPETEPVIQVEIPQAKSVPIIENSNVSMEQIKQRWNDILNVVKSTDTVLYATLTKFTPVALEEDSLVLLPEKAFFLNVLKDSNKLSILSEAIKKITGRPLKLSFSEPKEENIMVKEEKIEEIKQNKEVQNILKLFDGEITDVNNVDVNKVEEEE